MVAATLLGAATTAAVASAATAPHVTSAATVTVNATTGDGTVPTIGLGANTAVYDGFLTDPALPSLLSAAGVKALRYPGGSVSDVYDWQDNSVVPGTSFANPNDNFDNFMKVAQTTGAQPVITVNYGSGTADEAAAWVKYANVTHNYGVKYWEVGNEVYGNGAYGSSWEFDQHTTKNASTYAANTGQYIDAMKAADPSIKVGVVLTTPGNWPDGLVAPGDTQDWNDTVLSALGSKIDFVIVHFYPSSSTEAQMLGAPAQIAPIMSKLHSLIAQYSGTRPVQVMTTETNSGFEDDSAAAALFAADSYPTWFEQGAANVDWWDVHNGAGAASTDQTGGTDFNDEGMLSNATCASAGSPCEPAAETPFPQYFGLAMAGKFLGAGGTLLGTTSSQSLVATHAVEAANGSLNVELINKDPANSYQVALSYNGYTAATGGTADVYNRGATSITSGTASSSSVLLAPYSITVLHLTKAGTTTTGPGAPGTPTASGVTATSVTLSWPAATSATGYRVFRISGSSSTLVGSPTGTSLTVSGLTPNTAYTFDVVAVDSVGNTSAPSSPLTVFTGQPAGATCHVAYSVTVDWGGGFGANIAVTNAGTTTAANWTLQFTFPGNQAVSAGWGGNFSQAGNTVTVTAPSYAPDLAAGAATTPGFNAGYTGTNPAPTAFTLNGQPCTTG